MLNILFLGDIVGSPGRKAIKKKLSTLRKKYKLDLVIANADNITHGIGSTREKLEEVLNYGVDFFSNGDHVFRFKNFMKDLEDGNLPAIRPANYPVSAPGRGYEVIDMAGKGQVLLINLMGQVFMRDNLDSPFSLVDEILKKFEDVCFNAIIVDFHAEATSEKRALGFYLDGKVSLVVGTHTHVQTADEQILPKGTGYITDLGMVGVKNSILGEVIESVMDHYLDKTPHRYALEEKGDMALQGVFVSVDDGGAVLKIERINELVHE